MVSCSDNDILIFFAKKELSKTPEQLDTNYENSCTGHFVLLVLQIFKNRFSSTGTEFPKPKTMILHSSTGSL
jgi:hypothetical protein